MSTPSAQSARTGYGERGRVYPRGRFRLARLAKRFDQTTFENMLRVVENTTGRKLSDGEIRKIARGADEIDLANSGLGETMAVAYDQIHEIWKRDSRIPGLRTAAFISAINKIATSYFREAKPPSLRISSTHSEQLGDYV